MPIFQAIELQQDGGVAIARLNRPQKANSLDHILWFELEALAIWADQTADVRVLVLTANGRHFSAGIDFELVQSMIKRFHSLPEGQRQEHLYLEIRRLQKAFTAFEKCSKPVLAAIQGSCYGGAIDLITACDFRYATESAKFCIKEIDLAIVADIGTLQRLPGIIGEGAARELSLTGRVFGAEEAQGLGLVNQTFEDEKSLLDGVLSIAATIATKSPLAVRNTKRAFVYARDNTIEAGLDMVARMNAGILFSKDFQTAMTALQKGTEPTFDD